MTPTLDRAILRGFARASAYGALMAVVQMAAERLGTDDRETVNLEIARIDATLRARLDAIHADEQVAILAGIEEAWPKGAR